MKRGAVIFVTLLLFVVSISIFSQRVIAAEEVHGVFLFIDDYTNDSVVDAWAALNFTGSPIPPPNQVDDVIFEWFAPNGTVVFQQTVDPNSVAWALSRHRVDAMGLWTVNVTYSTNISVTESLSFGVLPNIWGPGQVDLNYTTVVGEGGSLTVLPGTEVRFPAGGALRVQGHIDAIGTDFEPIVFTSVSPFPAVGDWNVLSFLPSADNSSVISKAFVEYSTTGIKIKGSSPTLTYVTFQNNLAENLRAEDSKSTLSDLTVTGGTYGVDLVNSDITLTSTTITDSDYGLVFQKIGGRANNVQISNSARIGVFAFNGEGHISDVAVSGSVVGVQAENSSFVAQDISISGGQKAVESNSGSTILLENSTIDNVGLLHYSIYGDSRVMARNVELIPASPLRRDIKDTSILEIQNTLWVRAESYDDGAVLPGTEVEVFSNRTLVGRLLTMFSGIAGPFHVTYGLYNRTTFMKNTTVVVVQLPGYAFANNSRLVNMVSSHIEVFKGSIYDYDRDGNPDFNDTDDDNDGLSDSVEQQIGTNPRDPDTDSDGMPDGWEFGKDFDPLDTSDGDGDADGDGLSNLEEFQGDTDPRNPDSDYDGMPDGWEIRYGFNPLNSTDADQDADGDSFSNLDEYRNGTNPRNAESRPPPPPIDLGPLGVGDYWPILLLPLGALVFEVIFVSLAYIFAVPRRKRGKIPGPKKIDEED